MFDRIETQSENIRNSLEHFVEWARTNVKPIITCSMVTGIATIALIAASFATGPVGIGRLFIITSLALVCLIYDIYGAFSTTKELTKALSRRLGLSMR